MNKNEFQFNFKDYNFIILKNKYIINRKPLYITDFESDWRIKFKNVDKLFEYQIDGESIGDIISKLDTLNDFVLNGGRGASSSSSANQNTYSFSGAGGGSPAKSNPLLVARANTSIRKKTQANALKWFSDKYKNSKIEFAVEVDDNGFVHQYVKGGKHSVGIASSDRKRKGVKNTMIFHNHPSAGAFSDADLLSTASDRNSKGIVASGSKYNYIFKKVGGGKFKATDFAKAVRSAKMRGTDYNDAVDKWLKANQKKYGYTYTREAV